MRFSSSKKSFTFIDVLVGTSLVLIVFLGIFGVYQLGLKMVNQSKIRIIATALANQKIEQIHNLPYKKVGTNPHFVDEPIILVIAIMVFVSTEGVCNAFDRVHDGAAEVVGWINLVLISSSGMRAQINTVHYWIPKGFVIGVQ